MNKGLLLTVGLTVLGSVTTYAQQLRSDYVTWPSSPLLYNYVNAWVKGKPLTTTWNSNGEQSEWEDEEFFISRVKLKPYIRNSATQIYDIIAEKDKNLIFWVPIGYDNLSGVKTNALPNGMFDSEVFSMWQYVTHYGNWTSPYGWVPGGFADAAHKHGTAVSGVASIPNAALTGAWLNCITEMGNMSDSEESVAKLGDFLYYHGVDGLGYNSEYKVPDVTIQNRLNNMHAMLMRYMSDKSGCLRFENPWYAAVSNQGNIDFRSSLADWKDYAFGDKKNPRTIYFINYGWSQLLDETARTLSEIGRDPRDLYMGMDMQGGAKFKDEWPKHLTMDYSIGLWGAHDFNYLFGPRTDAGSNGKARQEYYQKRLEQWFTNGNRNPANRIDVRETMSLAPSDDWFGMSSFMTARSSLGWDLSTEPFISFFNLGNGTFFNWKGERCSNNEWYNLGVQDYMPTWRFWWAKELLGKTPDKVVNGGLRAEFTWDEAYVGGSSLRIRGTSDDEYLHLFKTSFDLKDGDVITVTYKLLNGTSDMSLILTAEGNEAIPLNEENLGVITTSTAADNGMWVKKTFSITGDNANALAKTIALVGFHFRNANNLDLCLGEFSIRRGSTPVPQAPVVTKTRLLCNNMSGVDGKIIFKMVNDKPAGEPVYNLDVNASMFKLYAQYQGGSEQFMGVTTSWAGLCYAAKPDVTDATAVRFGVSAVSVDTNSESPISWGEYMPLPSYETVEGIEIDKNTIKPNEEFAIKYKDPRHTPGTWTIYSSAGNKIMASTESTVEYACPGIEEVGTYDVVINEGTPDEKVYKSYVQITPQDKGALPEIYSLTVNDQEAVQDSEVKFNIGEKFNLGYTGRPANGEVSQGLRINSNFIGAPINDLGLAEGKSSFTIAAWVKLECTEGSSCGLSIENRADKWPDNNWGFFWMDIAGKKGSTAFNTKLEEGGIESYTIRTALGELRYNFTNSVIRSGVWTHIACTFDWKKNTFKSEFYINGVKQVPILIENTDGYNVYPTTEDTYHGADNNTKLKSDMWFSIGGGRGAQANYNDGTVDDVVVWKGAMTAEDVKKVMSGIDNNNLPSQVIAYWDMEQKTGEDNAFKAVGSKAGAPLSNFVIRKNASEVYEHVSVDPLYDAGSPFIEGSSHKVETTPTWEIRNIATVTDASGNDVKGSANVSFPRGGDYTVRLSLDNSYGSNTKDYPVFRIIDPQGGISDVAGDDTVNVYTVNGILFVEFASEGDYTVSVHDTTGRLAGRDKRKILAGENMCISLSNAGVYVVSVEKDNQHVRTIKVLNK